MRRDVAIVGAALVTAMLPAVAGDYWVGLMTQSLIYGGVAATLALLVGYAGLPSLGHAAFFGTAGYGVALLTAHTGMDPMGAAALSVGLTVALAAVLAPFLTRLRGLGFITVTLAFGQVMWGVAIRGGTFTGGENGVAAIPRPLLVGDLLASGGGFFVATVILVAGILIVASRIADSPFGLSLVGLRDADQRMTALGYHVHRHRSAVFIIAAAFGAVLGVWFVFFNQFVGPSTLDWRLSATFLLAVVVGGRNSLWGPFLAGVFLKAGQSVLTGQTSLWPMVLGILYVFTVLIIPDGITSIPNRMRSFRGTVGDRRPLASEGTP
jgi:branched-chain amino acid transport system permease protein